MKLIQSCRVCTAIIGYLMYPDLGFSVTFLSRYRHKPVEKHLLAAKHVLHYWNYLHKRFNTTTRTGSTIECAVCITIQWFLHCAKISFILLLVIWIWWMAWCVVWHQDAISMSSIDIASSIEILLWDFTAPSNMWQQQEQFFFCDGSTPMFRLEGVRWGG